MYADLKIQDKVELEVKKIKAENMDKDGLKEAEARRRFMGKTSDHLTVRQIMLETILSFFSSPLRKLKISSSSPEPQNQFN